MKVNPRSFSLFAAASLFCANAQAYVANTASPEKLPPAQSTNEPRPTAPTPFDGADTKLVKQAGIGSEVAYGRAGVLELGGGVTFSGSRDGTLLSVAPTIGWFFADNFELSAIAAFTHNRIGQSNSNSYFTALLEPSAHIPIVDSLFLFGGLGAGLGYDVNRKSTGFALAPRLGANIMVGRSGVLTPSATWNFATNSAVQTQQGTMLALNNTYGINVNYTVMW